MPEIGTSGSMSGDGKRSVGHRPQAAAPILDSTDTADLAVQQIGSYLGYTGRDAAIVAKAARDQTGHFAGALGAQT
jgi:hypothetical protein